nr:MAG TPA: hypothetical protein [Caudoviricetes sp.]
MRSRKDSFAETVILNTCFTLSAIFLLFPLAAQSARFFCAFHLRFLLSPGISVSRFPDFVEPYMVFL